LTLINQAKERSPDALTLRLIPEHSRGENGYTLDETIRHRLVVVSHVEKGSSTRIISAWLARNPRAHRDDSEMRPEYDFSKGTRGKYAKRFAKGTNVVVLDPDVAKVFKNSQQVNEILRTISKIATQKPHRAI
jgi:hypothetical protein